jgi:transposase-like protein
MTRKRYMPTFRAQVVHELLKEEQTLTHAASEHGVHSSQLIQWRATALDGLPGLCGRRDSTVALKADYEARLAA